MRCLFPIILFLLSEAKVELRAPDLVEKRTIIDEFFDVIRTSDDCNDLFYYKFSLVPRRNRTKISDALQRELFEQYIDMRKFGLLDEDVEPLLNMYCRAKCQIPLALNYWRPPEYLTGNYTWNLMEEGEENKQYQTAVKMEKLILRMFEENKRITVQRMISEKEKPENPLQDSDLKFFYRIAAFIVTLSLALSIQNVLRMIYEENENEEIDLDGGWTIRGEIFQILVLGSSLITLLLLIYSE